MVLAAALRSGVPVQLLLAATGMAAAAVVPPAHGAMLAVPLTGGSAGETINIALANGATVEGMGVLAGSVVVRGERARLAAPMRAHGIVLIVAASALCQ